MPSTDGKAGELYYDLDARLNKLETGLKDAEVRVQRSAKKSADDYEKPWTGAQTKVREGFGKVSTALATVGIGLGLATAVTFFSGAISAASDLNETVNKTQVVFGDASASVLKLGDDSATALGMSKNEALAAAATYGNLFRSIGLATDQSAAMSTKLVGLAADLASFNNANPEEVLEALRSGLVGEVEPLRKFGINLSEARLKQVALNMGLDASGPTLSAATKAQAAYAVILQDSSLAQGDFARTASGLANTQRTNAAKIQDSLAKVGTALLPLAQAFADFAGVVIPALADGLLGIVSILKQMPPEVWIGIGLAITASLVPAFIALGVAAAGAAAAAAPFLAVAAAIGSVGIAAAHDLGQAGEGIDRLALNFGDMGDRINQVAEDTGRSIDEVKMAIDHSMRELGMSFDDAAAAAEHDFGLIGEAAERSAAITTEIMDHAASERADALAADRAAMKTAADTGIKDPIVDATQEAHDDAVEIVRLTPADLAKALEAGQTDWQKAIDDYNSAVKDNLLAPEEKRQLTAAIAQAAKDLTTALKSGDPEWIAAAEAKKTILEDRLFALQHDVPGIALRTGTAYADALSATKRLAAISGGHITKALQKALEVNLSAGGAAVAQSWLDGLASGTMLHKAYIASGKLAGIVARQLHGSSPPPEGPLHTIDLGGRNVARAWADGWLLAGPYVRGRVSELAGDVGNQLAHARMGAGALYTNAAALDGPMRSVGPASAVLAGVGGPGAFAASAPSAAPIIIQFSYQPTLSTASPSDLERIRRTLADAVSSSFVNRGLLPRTTSTY